MNDGFSTRRNIARIHLGNGTSRQARSNNGLNTVS
jgi:hypothetical protein